MLSNSSANGRLLRNLVKYQEASSSIAVGVDIKAPFSFATIFWLAISKHIYKVENDGNKIAVNMNVKWNPVKRATVHYGIAINLGI